MPKVSTYNIAGVQTGEMELNDSVFGVGQRTLGHTCY